MKGRLFEMHLRGRTFQQRCLLGTIGFLGLLNVIQACALLCYRDKVVILPPQLSKGVWIRGDQVSPSYIEEMALFVTSFMLEMSPESAAYKRDVILRMAASEGYGSLKAHLLEDERRIRKENVVTAFQAQKIQVQGMTARVTGDLIQFVGAKKIAQTRKTYVLTFCFRHGRLLVTRFQHVGGSDD